jgi:general secretion pathway protein B
MSFILDALKKSESDRQRQSGPSLFEVKVAPPRRSLPVWAIVVAVLLAINVIVISWMLLRHPAAPQPAAPASAATAPPAATSHASGQDTVPAPAAAPPGISVSAGSAPAANATPPPAMPSATPSATQAARASSESAPPAVAPPAGAGAQSAGPAAPNGANGTGGDPSDTAPAVEPGAMQGSGVPQGAAAGDLPLYQQVVSSAGLPELHLDLHVFAARPQDRFVMINMHRLGDGDSLPNGVQVEAIRPDGVVLSYHGTRFLLPRN